jgi:hypothetical protein
MSFKLDRAGSGGPAIVQQPSPLPEKRKISTEPARPRRLMQDARAYLSRAFSRVCKIVAPDHERAQVATALRQLRAHELQRASELFVDAFVKHDGGKSARPLIEQGQVRMEAVTGSLASALRSRQDVAREAFVQHIQKMPLPQRMAFMLRAQQHILMERKEEKELTPEFKGLEAAIKKLLTLKASYEEGLADLGLAVTENETVTIDGTEVDSGLSNGFFRDLCRDPYHIVRPDGRHELLMKPPGFVKDATIPNAAGRLAQEVAAGDMKQLAQIGRYAMQSLFEPALRVALTDASPFRMNGRPGQTSGKSMQSYAIQRLPDGDPRGGYILTGTCRRTGENMMFQRHDASFPENVAPESFAEITVSIHIDKAGKASLMGTPKISAKLVALPED